jgi:hypothetical protein
LGGGLVKDEWFKRDRENERPERFERIVQSWDTANKATELGDFSVRDLGSERQAPFPPRGANVRRSFAAEIPNRRARVHAPRPDGGTPRVTTSHKPGRDGGLTGRRP